jgi:uncharacterized membrane protein SirB2
MIEFAEWLQNTSASATIRGIGWFIPLLQSIHLVTIGIVFVSSLMTALRVLGRVRADEPFAAVWARFAPWLWGGLIVMMVTGLLLVAGEPVREVTALSFWLKMVLLAIGVAGTVVLGRSLASKAVLDFSTAARTGAIALVALWLAIIFLGRGIAYDVEIWGSHSPQAQDGT